MLETKAAQESIIISWVNARSPGGASICTRRYIGEVKMPKAYFEPENLNALVEVFTEAKRRLNSQDLNDPTKLDWIAHRILSLAAEGVPPQAILQEIAPDVEASHLPPERKPEIRTD
jgi:hypothetical protein